MSAGSVNSSSGATEVTQVSLAPVFPRPIAIYLSIPLIAVCWILPFRYPADADSRVLCILLGIAFLLILFIPKLGTLGVNRKDRMLFYREDLFASLLHPWRKREARSVEITTGSKVTIGEWLDENAFVTRGIRVTSSSGARAVLFQQKFGFTARGAARMAEALEKLEGVKVETVRLDEQFKPIPWEPSRENDRVSR